MTKLRISEMEKLSRQALYNHKDPCKKEARESHREDNVMLEAGEQKEEETLEIDVLWALNIEHVAMSPTVGGLQRQKRQERDPSLEPREGSSFVGLLQTSDLQNYKIINLCGLKPLSLW